MEEQLSSRRSAVVAALLTVGLIGLLLMLADQSAAAAAPEQLFIYLVPRPDAHFVSSQTTLAFRLQPELAHVQPEQLQLWVQGSQSGLHPGRLHLAGDGRTLIFTPRHPFAAAETVLVSAEISPSARRAGFPARVDYQFDIAGPAPAAGGLPGAAAEGALQAGQAAAARGLTAPWPVTLPADFPAVEVLTATSGVDTGYIFLSYFDYSGQDPHNGYLLILDNLGHPVYYKPLAPLPVGLDFKKQPNGLLTYYNPHPDEKRFWALDESYTLVDTYQAGNGYNADQHDLQILNDGSALLMIYDYQTVDMSVLVEGGDPDATVVGCIVQIVDPADDVLFEWRSWDHISILDSNQDLTADFIRYIHCNSLDEDLDGNILISSRHLDEVTKVDRQTGEIIWRLGGKGNQFVFTNDPGFFFQHDARRRPNGHLTLFDNRTDIEPLYARAVEYALDETNMVATLVWEYRNDPDSIGRFMGNHQRLPNGNALIGWGLSSLPVLTEVTAAGEKVFELAAAEPHGSYRSFRFPWQGYPTWPPVLAAFAREDGVRLYFSWNGDTEAVTYRIYAGPTPGQLSHVATVPRDGFETSYDYNTIPGLYYFQVRPVLPGGDEGPSSNTAAVLVAGRPLFFPMAIGN